MNLGRLGLAALLLAPAAALALRRPGPPPPAPGSRAPEFDLPGTDGARHSLAGHLGRWIVLAFFPMVRTPGCNRQLISYRDNADDLERFEAALLAASTDAPSRSRAFAEERRLRFPLLSDPGREASRAYGVLVPLVRVARRALYVIDPEGVVRAVVDPVSPATAGPDLAALLDRLQVPRR